MLVCFEFLAQARAAAGQPEIRMHLDREIDVRSALRLVAETQGEALSGLLFDQQDQLRSSVLIMVNGHLASLPDERRLIDGDVVSVLPPIGGG